MKASINWPLITGNLYLQPLSLHHWIIVFPSVVFLGCFPIYSSYKYSRYQRLQFLDKWSLKISILFIFTFILYIYQDFYTNFSFLTITVFFSRSTVTRLTWEREKTSQQFIETSHKFTCWLTIIRKFSVRKRNRLLFQAQKILWCE